MSNAERKENLPGIIKTTEPKFTELAKKHNLPDFTFARESEFAMQILRENEYLENVAIGNPDSLKKAIINVAAVGLSLSPVLNQAYLIPRKVRGKMKVCLDISYQGLIFLCTSRGAIVWAKAELVKEKDDFELVDFTSMPKHKVKDIFADRGNVRGGYSIAKIPNGDLLVDFMSLAEINQRRDRSESWKAYQLDNSKTTPWKTDEVEMQKKTLLRHGWKSWPKSTSHNAIDHAMRIVDEIEGEAGEEEIQPAASSERDLKKQADLKQIREYLEALDRPEVDFVDILSRATNRKIEKLEDLTPNEAEQQLIFVEGMIDETARKLEKSKKGRSREKAG